ncbi:DgyrCDS2863 [Dimorphilus gyrociliatus]|uniref:DgyrCDS2863 n=2 Tax=Dimorphilus gyrociliatus TaxID=2664684 RepID=A0A7I8VCR4_9ANNE|nr:DgyrCDS2863 [Dimorphilus gyrociliatus]
MSMLHKYSRKLHLFLLIIVSALMTLTFTYYGITIDDSYNTLLTKVNIRDGLLINTTGCKVEYIAPFSPIAKQHFTTMTRPDCTKKQKLKNFTWVEDGHLKISKDDRTALISRGVVCKYYKISRKAKTDFGFSLGAAIPIDLKINYSLPLKKIEFLKVICQRNSSLLYENYHTNVFWKRGKALYNQSQSSLYNLLFVGIDSTSRNNLIRYMPKVYDYLLKDLNAIDYEGFIKVAGYTLGNIGVMLRGKWVQEWKGFSSKPYLDKYRFAFQDFADKGYVTLFSEDDSQFSMFKSAIRGFKNQPMDYWGIPFTDAASKGKLSPSSLCFGQKTNVQALTDWVLQYQSIYKDQKWWAHIHQAISVHSRLDTLGALEKDYLHFFQEIKERDVFKNSFLFFYADHGLRYGTFRQTYVGRYEEHLPFMIIVPPRDFIAKYPTYYEHMRLNSKKLSTYFDIHKTLYHLLNLNNEKLYYEKHGKKRGESLFNIIPDNRTCQTAPLRQRDCLCKTQMKISTENKLVRSATSFAFSKMRSLVKKHDKKKVCKTMSLSRAVEAFILLKSLKDGVPLTENELKSKTDSSYAKLVITFIAKPSFGIFEAMVGYSYDSRKFTLLENFERLDKYGNQSDCINNRELKGICYCKL